MSDYLKDFFEEKDIPYKQWEIEASNGEVNFIGNDVVIESIFQTSGEEKTKIESILRRIDFYNGDINHFLEHLARGLVEARLSDMNAAES